ncbi:MAG TPA: hypothetical protein VFP46_01460 [Candidatus Paceibacterota bacterium]|nr:hypothetical protein [Candidatus Paceibacterota bacterium]
MSHTRLWIAAAIIAAVIVVGFVLTVPHTTEAPRSVQTQEAAPAPTVSIRDSYKKGTHTLTGSVLAPDACTTIAAEASLAGGTTSPAILVALTTTPASGVCLELPTSLPFKVTVSAPAKAAIQTTLNGALASTTP